MSVAVVTTDIAISIKGESMVKIRDIRFGTIRDVEKRYADVLVKLGKHSLVEEIAAAPLVAPYAPEPMRTPERTEASEPEPVAALSTESEPALIPEKPRRQYRRRDMTAEDE